MKSVFFKANSSRIQVSGALSSFEDLSLPDLPKDHQFLAFEAGRSLKTFIKQNRVSLEREFFVTPTQAIKLLTNQEKHLAQLAGRSKTESFLNRYPECLPYTKNNVPSFRYINASFISGPKIPEHTQLYIATQAPLSYSITEFWHMVFTQDCSSIFTLCGINDCKIVSFNQGACEIYWPELGKLSKFEKFEIKNLNETQKNGYVERELEISNGEGAKKLKHFQYLLWPDKSVPIEIGSFLDFLAEVKREEEKLKKIVVHCSAGVGRTGTLLALSHLKSVVDEQYIGKVDFGVSVFSVVRRLREQRMHMVQTLEQYEFIHWFVEKWVDEWNEKVLKEKI